MGLFDSIKTISKDLFKSETKPSKSKDAPKKKLHKEDFFIVGVRYYENNLKKLACVNKEYNLKASELLEQKLYKVYRYTYINKPVKLVPEPTNPHDINAVAVYIAGELVGYISSDENIHVLDILKNGDIKYITASITGGDYKNVNLNGDVSKCSKNININVRIGYSV